MFWIYFTSLSPSLSWNDRILVDFLRDKGVDVQVESVDKDVESLWDENDPPDRIIISNMFSNRQQHPSYYDFFVPLLIAEVAERRGIHMTYIDRASSRENGLETFGYMDRLLSMRYGMLRLNLWTLMNDDLSSPDNGLVACLLNETERVLEDEVNITVAPSIFPLIYDMVHTQKTGRYDMSNPTTISYGKIRQLYDEYLSSNNDVLVTHSSTSTVVCKGTDVANTKTLEEEYFVLPSYQALQRLMKTIRKSSTINRRIHLEHKCTILVTGGFGFIGSNLIHMLYHQYPKCQIVNIDRLDYCSRHENLDGVMKSDRVQCYETDLCETSKVHDILVSHQVDYVFHLAAQSHVDNSFNNSLEFSRDNVFATHSLLEACKNYGKIKRFLHVSTDEIYGETLQMTPFGETELPNPTNPYAATKVGAEYIAKSYFHCFELPIVMVRGNNVYGPRQYPEKMIPRFITATLRERPCTVAGNGLMQRNFLYVEDMCRGLLCVMEKGVIDEIYNIGSEDEMSVLTIARRILESIGVDADNTNPTRIQFVKDRFYNDFRYSIDSSKIRALGWKPITNFHDGLLKTIDYYRENMALYKADDALL